MEGLVRLPPVEEVEYRVAARAEGGQDGIGIGV